MSDGLKQAVARRGSFVQTLRAVAWSFFGIRRGSDYENDIQKLNPIHVIVAGVMGAGLFVVALVMLAKWVVRAASA